jgi:hypothetical protein
MNFFIKEIKKVVFEDRFNFSHHDKKIKNDLNEEDLKMLLNNYILWMLIDLILDFLVLLLKILNLLVIGHVLEEYLDEIIYIFMPFQLSMD